MFVNFHLRIVPKMVVGVGEHFPELPGEEEPRGFYPFALDASLNVMDFESQGAVLAEKRELSSSQTP